MSHSKTFCLDKCSRIWQDVSQNSPISRSTLPFLVRLSATPRTDCICLGFILVFEMFQNLSAVNNLVGAYFGQGRWKESEDLRVRVLASCKKVLGNGHMETLSAVNNLASTYYIQERWKEAEALQFQLLAGAGRRSLSVINNLANTYSGLGGRWEEAESLQLRVLAARKRVDGDDHPDTLLAISSLANTYFRQERWKDAVASTNYS